MKCKFLSALIFCMLIYIVPMNSQTYEFTVTQAPYVDLQGGTPLVDAPWDDPSLLVPIGFNFELFDQTTQFLFLTENDSYILFSNSLNMIVDIIVLFGADLIDRGSMEDTLLSPITYATTGTTGNRVLTLEFENAGFYNDLQEFGISTDYVNIQLKLYENTGNIEFHYGPNSVTRPEVSHEGEGPIIGLFENYDLETGFATGEVILLDGDPANPVVVTEFLETYLDGTIPANTLYRFSRETTAVNEVDKSGQQAYYYPNPSTGFAWLSPELTDEIISPVQIINSQGIVMLTDADPAVIEFQDLPLGIYALHFKTVDGSVTQRIFLERQ